MARNATPLVPKAAALEALDAPENVSQRSPLNSAWTSPTDSIIAISSASSRAPAIQPVQRSMFSLASSGKASMELEPLAGLDGDLGVLALDRLAQQPQVKLSCYGHGF